MINIPRYAREKSESGIYHMMLRGINRQDIFEDNEDRQKFLETIKHYKTVSKYEIYGYCLMSNHVHLLIGEKEEALSLAVKRICSSYVYWFNWKYGRCGHLFQERYKSEAIEDDRYFLTVLRYIHQNPIKAGLIRNISDYVWSSYNEYIINGMVTDVKTVLELFSNDTSKAVKQFQEYMNEPNEYKCLEYEKQTKITDSDVRAHFVKIGVSNISDLQKEEKKRRNELIRMVKAVEGITVRQLSRITGISKSVIDRI